MVLRAPSAFGTTGEFHAQKNQANFKRKIPKTNINIFKAFRAALAVVELLESKSRCRVSPSQEETFFLIKTHFYPPKIIIDSLLSACVPPQTHLLCFCGLRFFFHSICREHRKRSWLTHKIELNRLWSSDKIKKKNYSAFH